MIKRICKLSYIDEQKRKKRRHLLRHVSLHYSNKNDTNETSRGTNTRQYLSALKQDQSRGRHFLAYKFDKD